VPTDVSSQKTGETDMYDEKNTECALYGTEECELLNAEGCLQCAAGKLKPSEQQAMRQALARLRTAAPEETVRSLYEGDECLLCKGERGRAECYALFDMSRPDREGDWTYTVKKGAAQKLGAMVLPLQVCACKDCRRRYRRMEFLPTVLGLLIAGAGLALTTNTKFYKLAYNAASWLPVALFLAFVVIALLAAFFLRRALVSSYSKKMHMDVGEIEAINKLQKAGWREVEKKTAGASKLVFANKLREHGVYTASHKQEEEVIPSEEE